MRRTYKKSVEKLIEPKNNLKDGQGRTFGFCDVVSLQPYLRMISKTKRYLCNKPFIVQYKTTQLY